jgi:hypothetical protein
MQYIPFGGVANFHWQMWERAGSLPVFKLPAKYQAVRVVTRLAGYKG